MTQEQFRFEKVLAYRK